jgi:pyrroloquinoline-quinone synthase
MTPLREIERSIERRHLLKHPFYTAWSKGEVPMPTLRAYAGQYYHFESNFPRYVAATYARLDDARDRRVLLENLTDEEGRAPTHPELWVDFARSIGARWATRRPPPPRPATVGLCRTYEQLTLGRGSPAQALGALYAYERQFPAVAAEKSRGLRAHYGVGSAEAHEFFRVHTEADVAHSAAERSLLAKQLRREAPGDGGAQAAVERTLGAWWSFLDSFGVHDP